ncbi:terminase large subunit [Butyribacter intestini]|uniref:terminase large subunit n=1 Tax=Butyribacter intestini TaxID=1703332 RepID=UPI003AF18FAD
MAKICSGDDFVTKFAKANVKNKKRFGEDARLAFKRHLDDIKRSKKNDDTFPYVFDEEKAKEIIEFANKLTIAEDEGDEIFTCDDWQEFILGSLFGWVHKDTGKRRFTDSYVQIARQQGKSVLDAILGMYCGNFCGYNYAQIYCTATKSDQAKIVFNEMSKFIKADDDLNELFEIKEYKGEIDCKVTNGVVKALGRDTKSIDGFRPYLGIVDEYHAHKDNQMYKLLKGGTRSMKESLVSVITTAGFNLNGPCYELYKYCRRVLRGIDVNDGQFIYIAQMDEKDYIWNPDNWIKCCPFTGKDKELMSRMQTDAAKAKSMGGDELLDFMTKALNQWVTSSETAFIDLKDWEKCASGRTLDDFKGSAAYVGLDLSSGGDLTSLCIEIPYMNDDTGDKCYYIFSHSFMPKRRLQEHMDKEDNAPYVIWERENLLTVTTAGGGVKTDYKTILKYLHEIVDTYELDLQAICYDPHNASAFLLDLEDFGCDLIEIKQSARSLNDATKDFQLEVKAHNIEYNEDDKLLTRSMNDAILSEPNSFGEIKIDKMIQKNRIDPCDAVICAHKVAMGVEVDDTDINDSVAAYLKMLGGDDDDEADGEI